MCYVFIQCRDKQRYEKKAAAPSVRTSPQGLGGPRWVHNKKCNIFLRIQCLKKNLIVKFLTG